MQYGFIIPGGDVHTVVDLAIEAEASGWDGVFYWDGIYIEGAGPMYDPWAVLAAIAVRLGALDDGGFTKVGEATERKERATLLDESLAIVTGLWSGQPFSFHGEHFHVEEMTFLPPPVQSPRIPIWVVGAWPRTKSMQRALRYDGLLPTKLNADGSQAEVTPADIQAMKAYAMEHRDPETPFDIVWEGETPADDREQAQSLVRPWAEAGATWWMESRWGNPTRLDEARARIRQGPPRINLYCKTT